MFYLSLFFIVNLCFSLAPQTDLEDSILKTLIDFENQQKLDKPVKKTSESVSDLKDSLEDDEPPAEPSFFDEHSIVSSYDVAVPVEGGDQQGLMSEVSLPLIFRPLNTKKTVHSFLTPQAQQNVNSAVKKGSLNLTPLDLELIDPLIYSNFSAEVSSFSFEEANTPAVQHFTQEELMKVDRVLSFPVNFDLYSSEERSYYADEEILRVEGLILNVNKNIDVLNSQLSATHLSLNQAIANRDSLKKRESDLKASLSYVAQARSRIKIIPNQLEELAKKKNVLDQESQILSRIFQEYLGRSNSGFGLESSIQLMKDEINELEREITSTKDRKFKKQLNRLLDEKKAELQKVEAEFLEVNLESLSIEMKQLERQQLSYKNQEEAISAEYQRIENFPKGQFKKQRSRLDKNLSDLESQKQTLEDRYAVISNRMRVFEELSQYPDRSISDLEVIQRHEALQQEMNRQIRVLEEELQGANLVLDRSESIRQELESEKQYITRSLLSNESRLQNLYEDQKTQQIGLDNMHDLGSRLSFMIVSLSQYSANSRSFKQHLNSNLSLLRQSISSRLQSSEEIASLQLQKKWLKQIESEKDLKVQYALISLVFAQREFSEFKIPESHFSQPVIAQKLKEDASFRRQVFSQLHSILVSSEKGNEQTFAEASLYVFSQLEHILKLGVDDFDYQLILHDFLSFSPSNQGNILQVIQKAYPSLEQFDMSIPSQIKVAQTLNVLSSFVNSDSTKIMDMYSAFDPQRQSVSHLNLTDHKEVQRLSQQAFFSQYQETVQRGFVSSQDVFNRVTLDVVETLQLTSQAEELNKTNLEVNQELLDNYTQTKKDYSKKKSKLKKALKQLDKDLEKIIQQEPFEDQKINVVSYLVDQIYIMDSEVKQLEKKRLAVNDVQLQSSFNRRIFDAQGQLEKYHKLLYLVSENFQGVSSIVELYQKRSSVLSQLNQWSSLRDDENSVLDVEQKRKLSSLSNENRLLSDQISDLEISVVSPSRNVFYSQPNLFLFQKRVRDRYKTFKDQASLLRKEQESVRSELKELSQSIEWNNSKISALKKVRNRLESDIAKDVYSLIDVLKNPRYMAVGKFSSDLQDYAYLGDVRFNILTLYLEHQKKLQDYQKKIEDGVPQKEALLSLSSSLGMIYPFDLLESLTSVDHLSLFNMIGQSLGNYLPLAQLLMKDSSQFYQMKVSDSQETKEGANNSDSSISLQLQIPQGDLVSQLVSIDKFSPSLSASVSHLSQADSQSQQRLSSQKRVKELFDVQFKLEQQQSSSQSEGANSDVVRVNIVKDGQPRTVVIKRVSYGQFENAQDRILFVQRYIEDQFSDLLSVDEQELFFHLTVSSLRESLVEKKDNKESDFNYLLNHFSQITSAKKAEFSQTFLSVMEKLFQEGKNQTFFKFNPDQQRVFMTLKEKIIDSGKVTSFSKDLYLYLSQKGSYFGKVDRESRLTKQVSDFYQQRLLNQKVDPSVGIVKYVDSFSPNQFVFLNQQGQSVSFGQYFIIMEEAPGSSLSSYTESDQYRPSEDSLAILESSVATLEWLGQTQVAHRDLLGKNMIYDSQSKKLTLIDWDSMEYRSVLARQLSSQPVDRWNADVENMVDVRDFSEEPISEDYLGLGVVDFAFFVQTLMGEKLSKKVFELSSNATFRFIQQVLDPDNVGKSIAELTENIPMQRLWQTEGELQKLLNTLNDIGLLDMWDMHGGPISPLMYMVGFSLLMEEELKLYSLKELEQLKKGPVQNSDHMCLFFYLNLKEKMTGPIEKASYNEFVKQLQQEVVSLRSSVESGSSLNFNENFNFSGHKGLRKWSSSSSSSSSGSSSSLDASNKKVQSSSEKQSTQLIADTSLESDLIESYSSSTTPVVTNVLESDLIESYSSSTTPVVTNVLESDLIESYSSSTTPVVTKIEETSVAQETLLSVDATEQVTNSTDSLEGILNYTQEDYVPLNTILDLKKQSRSQSTTNIGEYHQAVEELSLMGSTTSAFIGPVIEGVFDDQVVGLESAVTSLNTHSLALQQKLSDLPSKRSFFLNNRFDLSVVSLSRSDQDRERKGKEGMPFVVATNGLDENLKGVVYLHPGIHQLVAQTFSNQVQKNEVLDLILINEMVQIRYKQSSSYDSSLHREQLELISIVQAIDELAVRDRDQLGAKYHERVVYYMDLYRKFSEKSWKSQGVSETLRKSMTKVFDSLKLFEEMQGGVPLGETLELSMKSGDFGADYGALSKMDSFQNASLNEALLSISLVLKSV